MAKNKLIVSLGLDSDCVVVLIRRNNIFFQILTYAGWNVYVLGRLELFWLKSVEYVSIENEKKKHEKNANEFKTKRITLFE